jgi:hypothetical protein
MKSVIFGGYRTTVESPRFFYPHAELWGQSTSIRAWKWGLHNWSRWFDIHTVGPQAYYGGIRIMRPDVLAWYVEQGRERPIYLAEADPAIMGSVTYPIEEMEQEFGKGHFGCQLDYMAALALHEGFDQWILYSNGAPYVEMAPDDPRRVKWLKYHRTFIWWLRLAKSRGVEIRAFGPSMFTREVVNDESIVIEPLPARYGYDMKVSIEQVQMTQFEGHPFHRD